jgi:hypothetical protein
VDKNKPKSKTAKGETKPANGEAKAASSNVEKPKAEPKIYIAFKKYLELITTHGQAHPIYEALLAHANGATIDELVATVAKAKSVQLQEGKERPIADAVKAHMRNFVRDGAVQIKGEPMPVCKLQPKPKAEPKATKPKAVKPKAAPAPAA